MPRVALVEDDDVLRELVVTILSGRGYTVQAFATLTDARSALDAFAPDLLISDVDLPDGCGLDLVGGLRDQTGRRIPAIVLSGRNKEQDFARGFAAGAVDYLAKPFTREELLARCSVHLARSTVPSAPPASDGDLPEKDGLAFGRYRVERELGRGGYGRVYLARDAGRGDASVALKVLAPVATEQDEARLRFIRETYTLASLKNPHVAEIYEVGAAAGRTYFAMEYVKGSSLRGHIAEEGLLDEGEVRLVARGLLQALAAVDRAGLVHRDLKPENVMLRNGRLDQPVLIDFGLAKRPFDRGITAAEMLVGTAAYMPPEVILGREADRRSDLFALGLTLRYALVGADVFPELDGVDLLRAIARGPIPPPAAALSAAFGQFLSALTAVHPEQRPADAVSALAELDALAAPEARRGERPGASSRASDDTQPYEGIRDLNLKSP
jgi:CheY-like chemotaxis protein